MRINLYITILAPLLILVACKKSEHRIETEDSLLIKKVTTVIDDSKGNDSFVSTEEFIFHYDASNRLSKIEKLNIYTQSNRIDTLPKGHDEFIYDQAGRLIRRNHFTGDGRLLSYDELIYNNNNLPEELSIYSWQPDPMTDQYSFTRTRYNKYSYNNKQLSERILYHQQYDANKLVVMMPTIREVFEYDPAGNIIATDVYPLSEAYGPLGELASEEEYIRAQQGHNPLFFGSVYSWLYSSGTTVVLPLSAAPLMRQKTTRHGKFGWPTCYDMRNFIIETGQFGYPERSIEVYEKEISTKLPDADQPIVLTERGKRDSRFEYIKKR